MDWKIKTAYDYSGGSKKSNGNNKRKPNQNDSFSFFSSYNDRMKLKAGLLSLAIFLILSVPAVYADDADIPYAARIPYKIIRGAANIALGWTEILLRPFGENGTDSVGEAMSMGVAHTLMRLAGGLT